MIILSFPCRSFTGIEASLPEPITYFYHLSTVNILTLYQLDFNSTILAEDKYFKTTCFDEDASIEVKYFKRIINNLQ